MNDWLMTGDITRGTATALILSNWMIFYFYIQKCRALKRSTKQTDEAVNLLTKSVRKSFHDLRSGN